MLCQRLIGLYPVSRGSKKNTFIKFLYVVFFISADDIVTLQFVYLVRHLWSLNVSFEVLEHNKRNTLSLRLYNQFVYMNDDDAFH